ncbi:MAG: Uma2 family endonuclease [Dehalococcoidia bacterium]|nr:Uma2 family endonuclease [Dehalococcoidia bacterium]
MTTNRAYDAVAAAVKYVDVLPDPPRKFDMKQRRQIYRIDSALRPHYAECGDVLVSGEGYLISDLLDEYRFAPDLIFTRGVKRPEAVIDRNGYVISEVGKPPDLVLEVASESTGRRDYTIKREGYAKYGIQEYWRFDETGGSYHDAPLAGDTFVNGEYRPIPINRETNGLIWGHSEVLGLDVCWDRGMLRFYDPVSGRFLPNAEELAAERDAAETERDAERAARAAAEKEARRLREELRQLRSE